MSEDEARRAVDSIIADLQDRQGLSDEWDRMDESIQAEIRDAWAALIIAAQFDP